MLPAFSEKCNEKRIVLIMHHLCTVIFRVKIVIVKIVIVIRADGNERKIVISSEIKEGTNLHVPLPLDFEL